MTRIVRIQWEDAAAATGWHDRGQLASQLQAPPTLCESVGYLTEREHKGKVTLVQTIGSNEVSGVFEIPTGCIKSVETICTIPITIDL